MGILFTEEDIDQRRKKTTSSMSDVLSLYLKGYKNIVVEGYDGVGKGKVIEELSYALNHMPVYRPNYNFWQSHELPRKLRWAINASYWDIMNSLGHPTQDDCFIFDRGMLSGAVYNEDESLARDYAKLIEGEKVLHVLVTCSEDSFEKYALSRGTEPESFTRMLSYTNFFVHFLEEYHLDYIIYQNSYDEKYAEVAMNTCIGCGHYSHGICKHPAFLGKVVDSTSPRCLFSYQKEVQDESL